MSRSITLREAEILIAVIKNNYNLYKASLDLSVVPSTVCIGFQSIRAKVNAECFSSYQKIGRTKVYAMNDEVVNLYTCCKNLVACYSDLHKHLIKEHTSNEQVN